MIRKNSLFCKIIRIKNSSRSIFIDSIKNFRPESEVCPYCKSKGNCHNHASYQRNLVDFIHGKVDESESITVLRVKCNSCEHTHAVLYDVIVPYAAYSLFFILRVLAEYFAHLNTVEAICVKFGISHSLLYKWKKQFLKNKSLWLGILNDLEVSSLSFLKNICALNDFSIFISSYFRLAGTSFMQHHANAATNSPPP